VPAGQAVQAQAPAREYWPAGQAGVGVADVEPAGQAYPAVHGPLHAAVVRPVVAPYAPGGHASVQLYTVKPVVLPYRPGGQLPHETSAPPVLDVPRGHITAVAFVDPAGQ
jgi:hypothetical protein